jgi:hypothetical protein
MSEKQDWVLSFTRENEAGRQIGRYSSRDDAMLAAERHFDEQKIAHRLSEKDDLGWQMSFNGATALSSLGIYRVRRI